MVTSTVRQIENQVELKIGWISILASNVFSLQLCSTVRPSSKAWVVSTHEKRREKIAATDTCVILSIFPAVLSS